MRRVLIAAALTLSIAGTAAASANSDLAASKGQAAPDVDAQVLWLAQADGPTIKVPERIDTDQDTVDFIGKVDGVGEVTLTANGIPIPLAADGEFRIRQQVPVGRSRLLLVAEDSRGGRVEQKIFVRRSAAAALTVDFGSYYALVIGNNDYRYLTDLNTAVVDAHAVAALLDEHYGFSVETLINATRYDVLSALTKMRATLMESDNLLIYYAGHGNLDVDSDEGYWLPVDAEPDNPVNWISNTTITSQLRAISAKHVLVVADSCYSGKLTRSVAASLRTGVERTAWLARMTVRRSRTALTSGGLEPVLDAGSDGHSVFARVFLDVLATNDEVLDGQSLFDAIKRPVVLNADQTPEYADVRKAGHDGGDFLFVPVNLAPLITAPPTTIMAQPDAAPSTMPVPDSGASERLFWESIKDSDDPEMFEAYFQEFPNGKFTSLARLKRNKLEKAAKEETQTALVVPPPEPETEPGVIEMDATFVALKTSNLRDEPTARSERVGRLKRDSPVAVTGKVKDENWYRIEYEGRTAYVYGTLIAEVDPAALDAWGGVVDTSDADEIIDFLDEYPDSIFTDRPETKLAALTTESGGATGSETQTPVVATPSTGANAAEMPFWDSIKDSDEPADYRAYLQAYPGGWFAELARVRAERPSSTQLAALPSQETEAVTRPKRSGRVINVQPIRDFRGLSKPILTDIVRNALRAVPNAVVISEQPGGDDDVVVSGSVLKFDQRQEPNPDYQAG